MRYFEPIFSVNKSFDRDIPTTVHNNYLISRGAGVILHSLGIQWTGKDKCYDLRLS